LAETVPDHLAYLEEMEKEGSLAFAGPLSDESGEHMNGEGMLCYRAPSFEAARAPWPPPIRCTRAASARSPYAAG
jgi:uncharacterized protein YciI